MTENVNKYDYETTEYEPTDESEYESNEPLKISSKQFMQMTAHELITCLLNITISLIKDT